MASTVADFMTPAPTAIESQETLLAAAQTMASQDIGALVVVEDEQIVGIVTDRDIVVRGLAQGHGLDARVGYLATERLVTVAPGDPVEDVVDIMRNEAVRRVPVVSGGELVGIVSIGDLAVTLDAESALADISAAEPDQ